MSVVITIVVFAIILSLLGALIEGLVWLLFVGIIVLAIGALVGYLRRRTART